MFIRNALTETKKLTVLTKGESIRDALVKMESHLSLPCLDKDGRFVGMLSKRTVFENFQKAVADGETYDTFLDRTVDSCVDQNVPTLGLTSHFEDTLDIIIRYPFVPIVEGGKLVGIVKRSDVNHALSIAFATNIAADTQRIMLGMAEVEGALQRLFTITHRLGINVVSAVTFDARPDALNRRLILKVTRTNKFDELCKQLERAGYSLLDVDQ